MFLAPIDDIRKELGFDPDMGDILAAITGGLQAAEPILSTYLDTNFALDSYTDSYFTECAGPNGVTQFRLSNGFATLTTMQVARWNETKNLLPSTRFDSEVGLATVFNEHFGNERIDISYTAGFPALQSDPETYDPAVVPRWLREAAILQCKLLIAGSAPIKEASIEIDTSLLTTNLNALLARKLRYRPLALIPV